MATRFAEESIEIRRENQRRREDRVLPDTHTTQPRRLICELACEHGRDGGEGKG